MINELNTSVIHNRELCYPANPPFSPHAGFPEYAFDHTQDSENKLYEGVRNLLYQLGYDKKNFNTANWNPFGVFIKPGQKVIIKPNWVNHRNPMEHTMDSLITHTSLVRAVTDYALLALKGSGQLVIGDAPIQMANFDKLLINSRMKEVLEFYRAQGIHHIEVMDFRKEITVRRKGIVTKRIIRDDKEFIEVNFHENSALHEIRQDYKKFRVTNYDPDKMLRYHNLTDHIYVVDREVLEADVVIYLPKLKTHQKAGITCAMKNSVGINVQKDCLVHHRKGPSQEVETPICIIIYLSHSLRMHTNRMIKQFLYPPKNDGNELSGFSRCLPNTHKEILILKVAGMATIPCGG